MGLDGVRALSELPPGGLSIDQAPHSALKSCRNSGILAGTLVLYQVLRYSSRYSGIAEAVHEIYLRTITSLLEMLKEVGRLSNVMPDTVCAKRIECQRCLNGVRWVSAVPTGEEVTFLSFSYILSFLHVAREWC